MLIIQGVWFDVYSRSFPYSSFVTNRKRERTAPPTVRSFSSPIQVLQSRFSAGSCPTECVVQENENIIPYMEEVDFDEKAFDMIGSNAPQDVKDAWMEAAKEVNANGLGIKGNGMLSHISQMMVQRLNKQMKGEDDVDNIDILGNTTESAIQATKQALYDLDHPKEYVPKSIEVQRACMKEREFYVAFLEKLVKL